MAGRAPRATATYRAFPGPALLSVVSQNDPTTMHGWRTVRLEQGENWKWRHPTSWLSCKGERRPEAQPASSGAAWGTHRPRAPASPSLPMVPCADPALVNHARPPAREPSSLQPQPMGQDLDTAKAKQAEAATRKGGAAARHGIGSRQQSAPANAARVPGSRLLQMEHKQDTRSGAAQPRGLSSARLALTSDGPSAAPSSTLCGSSSSSSGWAPMQASRILTARAMGPGVTFTLSLLCRCVTVCSVEGTKARVAPYL